MAAAASHGDVGALIANLKHLIVTHGEAFFKRQKRDLKKKKLSFSGSCHIGVGTTQVGHLNHVKMGRRGFIRHPFKNTGVYVEPVEAQHVKVPFLKEAYYLSRDVMRQIDPHYAEGEFVVQFAKIDSAAHYVKKHVDQHDVSHQYALTFGEYEGAALLVHPPDGGPPHRVDGKDCIVKFDARHPHEVDLTGFKGERYTVIWYKNYDRRQLARPDPIWEDSRPVVVYPPPPPRAAEADPPPGTPGPCEAPSQVRRDPAPPTASHPSLPPYPLAPRRARVP